METVLLTAAGVGGATVFGAVIGFIFKKISHMFSDIVLGFAAGVMLSAAVLGLIVPSLEHGGKFGILVTLAGIFAGAMCLNLIDRLVPIFISLSAPKPRPMQQTQTSAKYCSLWRQSQYTISPKVLPPVSVSEAETRRTRSLLQAVSRFKTFPREW